MLKCWEFEQEKRPTFKFCLGILDELHRRTLRNPTTAAHEGQYISTVIDRKQFIYILLLIKSQCIEVIPINVRTFNKLLSNQ